MALGGVSKGADAVAIAGDAHFCLRPTTEHRRRSGHAAFHMEDWSHGGSESKHSIPPTLHVASCNRIEPVNARAIVVFTDGGAKGNPGPGGWGAVIVTPDGQVKELGGGGAPVTNNQMEMTSAIEALRHLRDTPGPIEIYADSTYVINGITNWIWGWRPRGWKTAEGADWPTREFERRPPSPVEARGQGAYNWPHRPGPPWIPAQLACDKPPTGAC